MGAVAWVLIHRYLGSRLAVTSARDLSEEGKDPPTRPQYPCVRGSIASVLLQLAEQKGPSANSPAAIFASSPERMLVDEDIYAGCPRNPFFLFILTQSLYIVIQASLSGHS